MFSKIFILFAVLALFIQIAVATPPACVLKAVNGPGSSPGNVKDVCGNGSNVKQTLVSDCGTNFDAAMSAFSSICSSAGVAISTWDAASSTPLASSNSAGTSPAASSAMTTSDINSDTSTTSASAIESATTSVSSAESTAQSTDSAVTTATGTNTRTTSQVPNTSAATTSSGVAPTAAARRVEMSGMTIGAIAAAAGVMMAL